MSLELAKEGTPVSQAPVLLRNPTAASRRRGLSSRLHRPRLRPDDARLQETIPFPSTILTYPSIGGRSILSTRRLGSGHFTSSQSIAAAAHGHGLDLGGKRRSLGPDERGEDEARGEGGP
jgi:hypothetical protein